MFRRSAETLREAVGCRLKVKKPITLVLCMISLAFAACSSSPKKVEQPVPTKQEAVETKAPSTPPDQPPPIPPEATQRFENALTLLSAGDYARAEPELRRLSETYPEYSGALANLGILYLKTGKLPEAEKALHAAIERSPQNAFAYNQLGIVYRKMGRFKDADAAYRKALEIDPNYALAALNLGVLCDLYLQQPDRALAAFERYSALTTKPDARVAAWMKELKSRAKSPAPEKETATP